MEGTRRRVKVQTRIERRTLQSTMPLTAIGEENPRSQSFEKLSQDDTLSSVWADGSSKILNRVC